MFRGAPRTKQKLYAPFSDSRSRGFIWRTRRNARAFNAEHHGEWGKMTHGLLQRRSRSTQTSWARIEGPLTDWEAGICASDNCHCCHLSLAHSAWQKQVVTWSFTIPVACMNA
jgi:hypothetical protein